MFENTWSQPMLKHREQSLLRSVRADQSEQTGLFGRGQGGLKETGATNVAFRQRVNKGAAAVDRKKYMRFRILKHGKNKQLIYRLGVMWNL